MLNREYVCISLQHVEADAELIRTDYLPIEEAVRCNDCKYLLEIDKRAHPLCRRTSVPVSMDGYCAWGLRGGDES